MAPTTRTKSHPEAPVASDHSHDHDLEATPCDPTKPECGWPGPPCRTDVDADVEPQLGDTQSHRQADSTASPHRWPPCNNGPCTCEHEHAEHESPRTGTGG